MQEFWLSWCPCVQENDFDKSTNGNFMTTILTVK